MIKYINGSQMSSYIQRVDISEGNKEIIVPIVKYRIFDKYDKLRYGFSTRDGGVSKGSLESLNLSIAREPEFLDVCENHKRFGKAVGYDYRKLVFSDQVHKTNIHRAVMSDEGKGIVKESELLEIDGFITNEVGLPLITFYADCVPLFVYDPMKHAIGLAHSGWRGTVNKIGTILIERMVMEFGSNPEELVCAIGPSICQKCYEVSEDVADEFSNAYQESILDTILYSKGNGKYLLNLHEACKDNFLAAGVIKEHIAMPDYCTSCNNEWLFSHRFTNGKRGNLAASMMLI